MASTVVSPERDTGWLLVGDELGLVKVSSTNNIPDAINENVTDGLIIHYEGEPQAVTDPEGFPDIENVFRAPLVDAVLSRLYMKAAKDSVRRGDIDGA